MAFTRRRTEAIAARGLFSRNKYEWSNRYPTSARHPLPPVLRGPNGEKSDMTVAVSVACLCFAVLAGVLFSGAAAAQPPQRSVLVLDQSSAGLPFNTALATAIRLTLNAASKSSILFYSENLDANRFFGPEYENDFVQFLKAKYRERPIDVVIVVGVSALDFVARRREQIWPSIPVV